MCLGRIWGYLGETGPELSTDGPYFLSGMRHGGYHRMAVVKSWYTQLSQACQSLFEICLFCAQF